MSGLSRRSFAESLALAALAPLIGVRTDEIRLPAWSGAGVNEAADDAGALAKALAEVIRQQYESRLSAADLEIITGQIQSGLERVERLRQVELANGDEPDFVFSAFRAPPPAP